MDTQQLQTLLEVSRAIATIRDRKELLVTIVEQIKPVIPVDDTGILVLDSTGQYWQDWTNTDNYQGHQSATQLQQLGYDQWLPMDRIAEYTLTHTGIMTVAHFKEHYPEHPFGPVMWEAGLREMLYTPLVNGGRKLGVLFFDAEQEGTYTEQHLRLFKPIADLIAAAVANILANEEILEREREKTQLLEITELIAQVKATDDLLKLIVDKIKPLFGFHDCGLFVVSTDGLTHTDLAAVLPGVSPSDWNTTIASLSTNIPHPGSPVDWMMAEMDAAREPVLFDFKELAERFPAYPQIAGTGLLEMGYRDCLAANLSVRGKSIGFFCINALQKDFFTRANYPLFQSVTYSISIAVANIMANEEILEREREKTHLLNISAAISKIAKRGELLGVIYQQIQPIFSFDNAGLFITDSKKDLLCEILDSEAWPDKLQQQLTDQQLLGPWQLSLSNPNSWWMQYDIVIRDLAQEAHFARDLLGETQFEAGLAYGLKQMIGGPLFANCKKIGAMCFNSTKEQFYTSAHRFMFKSISEQVGVALANILANEEILEREREKTSLLSISEAIASARHAVELLTFIRQKAQQLIPFYDTGILIMEADGQFHSDLAVNLSGWDESDGNRQLRAAGYHRIPHSESYIAHVMDLIVAAKGPVIEDYQLRYEEFDYPAFSVCRELGYKEAIVTSLKSGGNVLGTFWLNSLQKGQFKSQQFEIFQALADQVTVAVSNIMADEEILERERQKSHLLEISQAIAQVQNAKQLLRTIYENVKPVFPFDNAGLYVFDQAGENYWGLFDPEVLPDDTQIKLEKANLLGPYAYKGHHPDSWGYAETAAIYSRPAQGLLFAEGSKERIANDVIVANGLKQMIGGPLYSGGKKIGLLCFNAKQADFYTAKHIPLYNAIADQISVALANILANEDMLQREREKALQLAVINALTDGDNWEQKMLALARAIQPQVPFDYVTLGVVMDGQIRHSYTFYQTGYEEYQTLHSAELGKLCGLSPERYHELSQQIDVSRSLRLNGTEFEHYCHQDELKRILSQTFRLQSHLVIPVPLTQNGCFLLSLYGRQPDAYLDRHLDLLSKLRQSIALTLDRLLAYEQVEALSKQLQLENTYLQEEVRTNYSFESIVGTSQAIRDVFQKVGLVGPMTSTVLILGETGTGKELVARAIHQSSPRQAKPLIKVNCAALPAQLIESELFGHERGAFTGAIERRIGKFELAHESTIFLDEIGELPLELQAKLLRAIQEREIERLGSNKVIQVDVRVLAATNRNLEKEVADGRFRSDLYFRLNVYPIKLPPLRERREDIPLLAVHFSQKLTKKLGKPVNGLSNGAIKEMQSYHWPGNIRELEHVIERGAIESVGGTIKSLALLKQPEGTPAVPISPAFQLKSYADGERELIINTLRYCTGRIRGAGGAAQILNVKATTLEARMKKLGIKRDFFITDSANPPIA